MRASLTPQRRWDLAVLVAGLVVLAVSGWVALRAAARLSAERGEVAQLRSEANRLLELRASFVQPTRAESLAWTAADVEARSLGADPAERLALARTIARLAENTGLRGVQAQFIASDTLGLTPRTAPAGISYPPASFALRLVARGAYGDLQRLIALLPPSVTVRAITTGRTAGAPEHRLLLGVFVRPEGPS
ncbi:MAG: hypothetical protein ACYC4J_12375 [Gemmatimonadaceae bacterium]